MTAPIRHCLFAGNKLYYTTIHSKYNSKWHSQFVINRREKIDFKTTLVFSRDYSKFSVYHSRDDVSIQNFNVEFGDINNQFNDFYYKLEGYVDRHETLLQK